MKFDISKAVLLQGLQTVQNIVSLRTTLPILSNVLLTAEKNDLWLTTTDLEVSVRCRVDANVSKAGSTTLPARRLFSIVRELPDSAIEFEVDEKDVASVKCGASFFKIIGLSPDEFPPVSKSQGKYAYTLGQAVLRDMLKKTSYSVSTDETRYVLNGELFSLHGGKLVVVATDGRRLALIEQEIEFPKEAEADLIVPTKTVNELMHVLGDDGEVRIHATENQILFEFGDVLVASKLVDGTYPNYRQVIPSQSEERIMVEREGLLTSLRRVSLVTTDRSTAIKLTFTKNKLSVTMTTTDVGEARETLPIKYSGKEISVSFNPDYLIDALKNLTSDEITMELTDGLSPGLIKCDIPFLYVLMPMRVS